MTLNYFSSTDSYIYWHLFFIAPSGRRPRGSTDDNQVCVIVVTIRRWADVGLWVAVCVLAKFSFRRPTTTFACLTQSRAISQSIGFTIRSMRDTNKFHFFFIFRVSFFIYIITVSFTMVIKISPGEEYAGGGRSTLKPTCVVPAWTLTSENASFGVCASWWSRQLTSDRKIYLLFWKCLQCRVVSESSFGAYVCHGRPVGLHRHQRILLHLGQLGHYTENLNALQEWLSVS